MTVRMKRFFPHLLWASGLLLVFVGLVVLPLTPYQRTTPELDLLAETQSERLVILGAVGFLLFVTGAVWAITRWLKGRVTCKTVA
jgi:hypothetical protein